MFIYYCDERQAEARLCFPLVYIEYKREDVKPLVQHHPVVRVELVEAGASLGGAYTIHELKGQKMEDDVSYFLQEGLGRGRNLLSETWTYCNYEIRLTFKTPVQDGEYDNIVSMIMTYSPSLADTPEMREAHAEWRAWVASLD